MASVCPSSLPLVLVTRVGAAADRPVRSAVRGNTLRLRSAIELL